MSVWGCVYVSWSGVERWYIGLNDGGILNWMLQLVWTCQDVWERTLTLVSSTTLEWFEGESTLVVGIAIMDTQLPRGHWADTADIANEDIDVMFATNGTSKLGERCEGCLTLQSLASSTSRRCSCASSRSVTLGYVVALFLVRETLNGSSLLTSALSLVLSLTPEVRPHA